jgi:hypothetical protein
MLRPTLLIVLEVGEFQREGGETRSVTTTEQALQALLDWQVSEGGVPTQPSWEDTIETEAGWAFFNVNGYLGTVTPAGEVITEPGMEPSGED